MFYQNLFFHNKLFPGAVCTTSQEKHTSYNYQKNRNTFYKMTKHTNDSNPFILKQPDPSARFHPHTAWWFCQK